MTDRAPSPESTRTDGTRKRAKHAAESAVRVPLWNEVLELETTLAPAAAAHVKATNRPMPWVAISVGLVVAVLLVIMASVEFYRRQLVAVILSRPKILQGHVPSFLEFQRPSSIIETIPATWQIMLQALASGLAGWLLVVAVAPWRRFAKRVPWVPVLVGAAIYFAIMWYITFVFLA